MLEQQRQQYLSLLGVESYVPRRLLSGAAVSHVLAPEQIGASSNKPLEVIKTPVVSAETSEVVSQPIDKQKRVSASSLLDDLSTVADKEQAHSASASNESAETVSSEPLTDLNFVLTVWRIHDQLLVIDSREPGAAYPTDRLLQNILRTIGYPLAQLPASEIIRWPVFANNKSVTKTIAQQNQDREQACAMVQAYITAQMAKLPVKALLCMGENAARFGLNRNSDETEGLPNNAESDLWGIPVAVTPSLFTMLQEPMLKAKAWTALQAIFGKG